MDQGKPFSASESPLVDFDAVCNKLRAAIEPARAHAISLHDEKGEVLWLSESTMGPDEHNAVREAVETFSNPNSAPSIAVDLGDARSAVLLRAVSSRRAMVGLIMLIMDSRGLKLDERGGVKMMTPKLQRVLMDFAGMRPDLEPETPAAPASDTGRLPRQGIAAVKPAPVPARAPVKNPAAQAPAKPAPGKPGPAKSGPASAPAKPVELSLADSARMNRPNGEDHAGRSRNDATGKTRAVPAASPGANPGSPGAGPAAHSAAVASLRAPPASPRAPAAVPSAAPAQAGHDVLEKHPAAVPPEVDRLHAALRRSPIALHVQRLVPLTRGSQLKRYEVLLRSKSDEAPNAAPQAMLKAAVENGLGSMIDRRVVTELVGWLVHHPDVWQNGAVMFSVNLTTTALHDEHFIKFVGLCLAKSSLPKAMIAFELDVSTATKMSTRVAEVAAALHRLGCPMVLDDFSLRTECFDLLRLPGVRYIKLASDITTKMRTDKLSQAAITAVVQMARVLGMHTVAKRTETPAEQEWLTALGVDFVQSHAMSPPTAIESLSKIQNAKA
jgi:EAL domain-containing protein (putative c-di-GMP-specific phosphodiesterase class I)